MTIQVSQLWRFPVKSLAGQCESEYTIDDWGPVGDRRWLLVDENRRFVTQRKFPKMCRLLAIDQRDSLRVVDLDGSVAGLAVVISSLDVTARYQVTVWNDQPAVVDAGDEAAAFFSQYLQSSVRLCYMPDDEFRQVDLAYASEGDRLGFADGFALLLCNEASLEVCAEALGRGLGMARFRPNIVVSGAEAFAEDDWACIRIRDIEFDLVKPCSRCAIPSVDPETGNRERDVVSMLQAQCRRDGSIYFGQNMRHRGRGSIAIGDEVEILSRR
ncbi:MAG: MOSC domain-containing protein [Spongiibacteraceae bacterium]